jgi:hypothetical protein
VDDDMDDDAEILDEEIDIQEEIEDIVELD